MGEFLAIMAAPTIMAFVLVGIHVWFGLHVVARGVIFVDIALAQVAALGSAAAVLGGAELGTIPAYAAGLGASLAGAGVIALTRQRRERVPQEAYIGITYAVAAAAMVLVLSRSPHGAEEVQSLLVGQILWVSWPAVFRTAVLYAILGLVHWRLRERFLLVSLRPQEAWARGVRVRAWDYLFYGTLAFVVTSSVQVAGVLMVFALLVVPAVMGMLVATSLRARLLFGWASGVVICLAGSVVSYAFDLPTGAATVCLFGVALAALWLLRTLWSGPPVRRRVLATRDGGGAPRPAAAPRQSRTDTAASPEKGARGRGHAGRNPGTQRSRMAFRVSERPPDSSR